MGRLILSLIIMGTLLSVGILWIGQEVGKQLNPPEEQVYSRTVNGLMLSYSSKGQLCLKNKKSRVMGILFFKNPDGLPITYNAKQLDDDGILMRWRLEPERPFCITVKPDLTSGVFQYLVLPIFKDMWWGVISLDLEQY